MYRTIIVDFPDYNSYSPLVIGEGLGIFEGEGSFFPGSRQLARGFFLIVQRMQNEQVS